MKKALVSFVLFTGMTLGLGGAATAGEIASFPVEVLPSQLFFCNFVNLTDHPLTVTRTFVKNDGSGTPAPIVVPPKVPVVTSLSAPVQLVIYCKLSFKGNSRNIRAGIVLGEPDGNILMGATIN